MISGGRTEQLYMFCRITGFMSHFLSFIVVEHIRFFHGPFNYINYSCIFIEVLASESWWEAWQPSLRLPGATSGQRQKLEDPQVSLG